MMVLLKFADGPVKELPIEMAHIPRTGEVVKLLGCTFIAYSIEYIITQDNVSTDPKVQIEILCFKDE